MAENPSTPADWYADPADPALQRWWDGEEWSLRLRPAAPLALVRAGSGATRHGAHFAVMRLDEAALAAIPRPKPPSRYFADRPQPVALPREADTVPPGIREVYRRSRDVATIDRHRIVRNPAANVGIVAAILTAGGLAVFQYFGISFTYLFAPAVIALAICGIAVGRARLTGAAVFRSVLGLLLAGPLTIVTVWAFAEQLVGVTPLAL